MASVHAMRSAADRLERASHMSTPTSPVRDILRTADVRAAYAVQDELNLRRSSRGAMVVGRKIGLTSPAVQQQLGVDQPDFGVLFDDMACADDGQVSTSMLLQPKVEAEVAFVLGKDLTGELDLAVIRGAVDYAVAMLEIDDIALDLLDA